MVTGSNGNAAVTITPNGVALLLGVLTATYLERISSRDDLEKLIESLSTYWSVAQERPAGQVELTATDEHTLDVILNLLEVHLRGSFEL